MYAAFLGGRRGLWIPRIRVTDSCEPTMWVLGLGFGFCEMGF